MNLISFICWVLIMNPPVYQQASNHAEEQGSSLRFEPKLEHKHGIVPRRKYKAKSNHLRSYFKNKRNWKPMNHEYEPKLVYSSGNNIILKRPVEPDQAYNKNKKLSSVQKKEPEIEKLFSFIGAASKFFKVIDVVNVAVNTATLVWNVVTHPFKKS